MLYHIPVCCVTFFPGCVRAPPPAAAARGQAALAFGGKRMAKCGGGWDLTEVPAPPALPRIRARIPVPLGSGSTTPPPHAGQKPCASENQHF